MKSYIKKLAVPSHQTHLIYKRNFNLFWLTIPPFDLICEFLHVLFVSPDVESRAPYCMQFRTAVCNTLAGSLGSYACPVPPCHVWVVSFMPWSYFSPCLVLLISCATVSSSFCFLSVYFILLLSFFMRCVSLHLRAFLCFVSFHSFNLLTCSIPIYINIVCLYMFSPHVAFLLLCFTLSMWDLP